MYGITFLKLIANVIVIASEDMEKYSIFKKPNDARYAYAEINNKLWTK